jgi:hypothetical protein
MEKGTEMKYTCTVLPLLLLIASSLRLHAAEGQEPVVIDPTVTSYDSIPQVQIEQRFRVGRVIDSSSLGEKRRVGTTRVRAEQVPVVLVAEPAAVIENSFAGLLRKRGLAADRPDTLNYVLNIVIRDFSLTETSRFMRQTMDGAISMEVSVAVGVGYKPIRTFKVQSHYQRTAFDTTRHAEAVARSVLATAMAEVLKSLEKL